MSLLFLAHRVPFPPDRGDKIRSFHVLQYLAKLTPVHLVAFADDEADFDPPAAFTDMLASCTILPRGKSQKRAALEALATGKPVSLTAFATAAMQDAVNRILPEVNAVYCFSGQMAQYLPVGGPPVVMDFVDVDSAKFAGFADDARGPMRWIMRREARLLGMFEREVASRVSASLFVSEAEAALFREGGATGRIIAVENGIDSAKFDPTARDARRSSPLPEREGPGVGRLPRAQPVETQAGQPTPNPSLPGRGAEALIVFTGQMDYRPNIDAVMWFARDILPLVRQRHPAHFAIVGRAPTAAVQTLASDHVTVTGAVDDVRGWLAAADVCVAPLKLARGIQNKVLEAMAMARPVVASTAAAEGIDHAGTIRVATTAREFADRICDLLKAPDTAATLGQSARTQVIRRYGWDARLAPLNALLGLPA
ncbi:MULTISPECIES: glycosyltransferase [unclassified Sphingomonas]|uniref:glycosyltransferase n=1 Tax=unclassified Sphingomonas TaxID=196159 RepID=UPI000FF43B7C|nr:MULTISPECIES: glycosyltransferase [unclassified Sphingomonas]RKE50081.1 glycosyl transferase family 1 [Sphingomonas sp. PP-CC-1A-547]TCM08414.1 glycosyl transferase family 1 [Sphingomonas sp. PP-CC-3G-468]